MVTKTPIGPGRYAVVGPDGQTREAVRRASGWLVYTSGQAYQYPTLSAIVAAVAAGEA